MHPDEELALLIANRLVDGGLIDPDRRDEVSTSIAAGTARPEDWRLWIELGPAGRPEGSDDAQN
jgi:hypothetical protein